ncbi:MAG: zinc metallopeptidase [Clostridia bacterium]|nr:zinc metallopeptidase [Clostridia bacterium]
MFYSYGFGLYAMIPVILLGLFVHVHLKTTYSKYSGIANVRGMTGAQMAESILRGAGIYDVGVVCIQGQLSDHFDPSKKVVRLSEQVYNGTSIASIGVAAHECGHAIQHDVGYFPIRLRSAVVGITNFSSKILYFLMIASLVLSGYAFSTVIFNIAILCYAVIFFFQLITLPVEFNASARAVQQIKAAGFSDQDIGGVRKVLNAAAMTYVASAVTALTQLLIMISRSRRRR